MEMKFFRAILNKTKKDKIESTNVRLEVWVDEIKNDIQNNSNMLWTCDSDEKIENI